MCRNRTPTPDPARTHFYWRPIATSPFRSHSGLATPRHDRNNGEHGNLGEALRSMFIQNYAAGFVLGLSLIVAIGAQNVYVIQRGVLRSHVFAVCVFCAVSDAALISIGVGGFGRTLDQLYWIEPILTFAGAAFLLAYGALAAWRALTSNSSMSFDATNAVSLRTALATCFAMTWLNPHVYLDTVVLLGTVSTQYENTFAFGAGAITASFAFFFALGYGARTLAPVFARPNASKFIDAFVAAVMWAIAFKLLFT